MGKERRVCCVWKGGVLINVQWRGGIIGQALQNEGDI